MTTQYRYDPENSTLSDAYNARLFLKLKKLNREIASERRKQEVSLAVRTLLFPFVLTRGIVRKVDEIMRTIHWQDLERRSGGQLPR